MGQPRLGQFWTLAWGELSKLGFDEELVRLREMRPETLSEFGPTDTAILRIGSLPGRVVLTEDGPLRGRCMRAQIEVLTTSEILSLWQDSAS